jgi:hypothetical protein
MRNRLSRSTPADSAGESFLVHLAGTASRRASLGLSGSVSPMTAPTAATLLVVAP